MKRLFFVLLIILIPVIIGQLQFKNIDDDSLHNIINLIREIVAWFFAILIVIFGIVATVLNLNRKNKKNSISDEP